MAISCSLNPNQESGEHLQGTSAWRPEQASAYHRHVETWTDSTARNRHHTEYHNVVFVSTAARFIPTPAYNTCGDRTLFCSCRRSDYGRTAAVDRRKCTRREKVLMLQVSVFLAVWEEQRHAAVTICNGHISPWCRVASLCQATKNGV